MKTENQIATEEFLLYREEVVKKQEEYNNARIALRGAKKTLVLHLLNHDKELSPLYNTEGDPLKISGHSIEGAECYLLHPSGGRTDIDDLRLECDFTPPYGREE